jgi:lipopolysaccharide biosynthesis regulator YciM
MYGVLLEEYKFEDAALTYFRNAVEISPELGRARMRMSEILFKRRRFRDAIRELELIPEPKINYQWASLLSRSYEKVGELSRAASVWETFLKRPRNSAQSTQAKAHMAALLDSLKRKLDGW